VQFSRHAKNEMRLYGISRADVEGVVSRPVLESVDERGNPRLTGFDLGERAIIVVVADDDLDFVITTFPGE
jgi:Domain of unknown function (DUF4258)